MTKAVDQMRLVSPTELSECTDIPAQTLANWRWKGEGPAWIKLGRHVRYRWADVEKWLDANAQGGAAA
ncbi:helix-turn-helix transcriptional regulator [Nocardiopsis salina]|uniref:helix-turn-helix transcriptional regulator n=1 Tax=Nocardiopsis salina TaxID=245836 RepID=UPI000344D6A3|nr:helix-turn-helix domain-containing protein [Nocardiopsis salina]